MAGYKETPRQKMIGMMYLVLTALLALNVSKEIMDAFLVVNESMETTNDNFSKKLNNTYSKFQSQFMLNKDKVGQYWEKAQKVQTLSDNLTRYIDSIKYVVIMRCDGMKNIDSAKTFNLRKIKRKDDYNTPTRYFIGSSEDGSAGEAKILRQKIEIYKKQILDLVDPKYRATIKIGLDTKAMYLTADGKKQNWEMHNFYRTIIAATVTILNEIKAEVKNIEFDVVNSIFSEVTAEDYKFDVIKARVIPESRFVFAGESYNAEIIVAAYETKGKPIVKWIPGADTITAANEGNANLIDGTNGIVNLTIGAGREGLQRFAGFMQVLDPNGQPKKYYFSDEYFVAKRAVSISPTSMLVFYKGVPNPLKVVVPGGGSDKKVEISYGTVTPTDSNYIVNIPASLTGGPSKAVVTVSATYGDKRVTLGSETFRLKNIPETYSVQSYTFITTGSDGSPVILNGQGRILTPEMVNFIKRARRDQVIVLTDIKVQAPDGVRKLQKSVTYRIN
ncbi:MAG: gliding motility protein GldM [Bacteroidetes bacterium]|nr:gliding motility protein GldM [Bacteroidota bacterium]